MWKPLFLFPVVPILVPKLVCPTPMKAEGGPKCPKGASRQLLSQLQAAVNVGIKPLCSGIHQSIWRWRQPNGLSICFHSLRQ
jgi:hypothetical protein